MEQASSGWLHGSSRPKWHPEDPQTTSACHGATKPSVAPCAVKTKWPPQNLEKTPADHGATKVSLAPWLSRSKMAPQRLGRRQSGAMRARLDECFETFISLGLLPETYVDMEFTSGKQTFKIICNYDVWSTHKVST